MTKELYHNHGWSTDEIVLQFLIELEVGAVKLYSYINYEQIDSPFAESTK